MNFPFRSIRHIQRSCVTFNNKLFLYDVVCQSLTQRSSWRNTHYRMSATAYSIHLRLSSISGGRPLHPQPKEAPCRGNRYPHNMDTYLSQRVFLFEKMDIKYQVRFIKTCSFVTRHALPVL